MQLGFVIDVHMRAHFAQGKSKLRAGCMQGKFWLQVNFSVSEKRSQSQVRHTTASSRVDTFWALSGGLDADSLTVDLADLLLSLQFLWPREIPPPPPCGSTALYEHRDPV